MTGTGDPLNPVPVRLLVLVVAGRQRMQEEEAYLVWFFDFAILPDCC